LFENFFCFIPLTKQGLVRHPQVVAIAHQRIRSPPPGRTAAK
jgi:hypothetical protein